MHREGEINRGRKSEPDGGINEKSCMWKMRKEWKTEDIGSYICKSLRVTFNTAPSSKRQRNVTQKRYEIYRSSLGASSVSGSVLFICICGKFPCEFRKARAAHSCNTSQCASRGMERARGKAKEAINGRETRARRREM
jgi:hypothetical protein